MRRVVWCAVLGVLAGLAGCRGNVPPDEPDPGPPPVEWSADMQAVADGNNRFALDLYAKLRDEPGNLFFSPYSAHTALAMTATGARGNTREQMVKVLHLPADEQKALASADLGRFYAHPRKDFELSVANALWGRKGYGWRPEFLEAQKTRFGAGFHEADFVTDPEGEQQRINRWVEEQTRDKIKELLKGEITPRTWMVLTNAIYFKGKWAAQFDPQKTHDAPFHLADGRSIPVPMMHRDVKCRYTERDGVQVLELPYRGDELAMVVILPRLPDGLPALEKQLTADTLATWLGELQDRAELPIYLPRFRIELKVPLKEHLRALGMTAAFSDVAADFSGMLPGGGPYISAITHKAFVDVNEEGTEAAAATAVVMATQGVRPSFHADRPFLFLIRDAKHGTILFMGRVTNPKE